VLTQKLWVVILDGIVLADKVRGPGFNSQRQPIFSHVIHFLLKLVVIVHTPNYFFFRLSKTFEILELPEHPTQSRILY